MTSKTIRHLFFTTLLHQTLCIISNPLVNSNWSCSPEMLNSGKKWQFFVPRDLIIWWMTMKNNRTPLLYYIKLYAAFQSHWHIQTGVTVRKRSIWLKIANFFLSRVTLRIDAWPWKTIGHIFYTTSSFVQYFKSIGEVKFELQAGNAQVG